MPAEPLALSGALLASATPAAIGGETPARPASADLPAAAGEPAGRRDGATAETTPPAPAGPREVTLSALSFRRYVEPANRRQSREPDPAGWVELRFTVDVDGRTRDIQVLDSSPPGHYEESALAAVRRWRFEPLVERGQPVESRTAVRLRFEPE